MEVLDGLLVLVVLAVLAVGILSARRFVLRRSGGTVDVSMRLRRRSQGRGWVLGVGRYDGNRLLWYRVFSFVPRPRRTLPRQGLTVVKQRRPTGPEALSLLAGAVVVECRNSVERVELAMNEAAVPGFLAWVEAAPDRGPEIS